METDPTGYGNLQNHNEPVLSQQTTVDEEIVPTIPLKLELKLLEKLPKKGTDVMSFKFSKSDEHNHLKYHAGQFAIMDLGTKEDPKGPIRSFTMASSPTEDVILITTRITRYTVQKEACKLGHWIHSEVSPHPWGNLYYRMITQSP